MMGKGLSRLGSKLYFVCFPLLIFLPLPHGTNIPLRRKPVMTIALIWANFAIYLMMLLSGPENFERIGNGWGYIPADNRIITLFTYQFLHGSFLHVLLNMLFLWIFGANVEDRLGRLGFLAFYLACGVAAILFFVHISGLELATESCVGASGSIYGVMGAFFVLFPLAEVRVTFVIMVLAFYWRIRTFWVAAFVVGPMLVLLNLLYNAIDIEGRVAFMAHVGGFLFAIPCGLLFRALFPLPKPQPVADIPREEDQRKPPQDEQERLVWDMKEALYSHARSRAIEIYQEIKKVYGPPSLPAVDCLALAEAMAWEGHFLKAVEVYKNVSKNAQVDESLRVRAAQEIGRLYIGPIGDIPRGVKVFRRALERFPEAAAVVDIRRELLDLEQKGYPVNWRAWPPDSSSPPEPEEAPREEPPADIPTA